MVPTRYLLHLAFTVWLSTAVAGMAVLWKYEAQPGPAATPPVKWPDQSRISTAANQPALLVWIHPRCPCTRATIRELERLLVHLPSELDCQVVVTQPPGCEDQFIETDLTHAARTLQGVTVVVDRQQSEAKLFGVATSGQALLYGADKHLLFSGGITPGRGHEGDNFGATSIKNLLAPGSLPSVIEPAAIQADCCSVYGCGLFDPAESFSEAQP